MKPFFLTTALIFALGGGAAGWQAVLATLGITQTEFDTQVREATRRFGNTVEPPWAPRKCAQAAKAMSEAQRAAAVKELGNMAKALVMAPAFQKAHAEYIKTAHKAVDHGIQVKSQDQMLAEAAQGKGNDVAANLTRQAAVQMAQSFREMPMEALKPMFQSDLKSWTRQAQSTGARKAKAEPLLARAKEIEPWADSKPEEFKKAYSLLKSAEMGGPATEAELKSTGNSVQVQEEQRQWNQFNLKGLLKKKLSAIVAEAGTVDFAAQTATSGSTRKFANPAYERKSSLWKMMFRAGKAPTMAAVDVANGWLKEL